MSTKSLSFPFQIKADSITDTGLFEGHAAVFGNIDHAGDVILPGAFTATLTDRKANTPICWQHDTNEIVGVALELAEDDIGLYVKAQLAIKTEDGNKAYELAKLGAIQGLSIGYAVPLGGAIWSDSVRQLKQIDLYEISLVPFPCNPEALIASVKSAAELTERDIERILRDAGFSTKEAKTIIVSGFKSLKAQRDVDDSASLLEAVKSIYHS